MKLKIILLSDSGSRAFPFNEKNQKDIDWNYEEMKNKIEQNDKTF